MMPTTRLLQGRRIPALLAVLAGQLFASLLAVIFVLVVIPREEAITNFVLGISFSQVTLLAAWNALGDGKLALRPIGSLLWLIAIWLIAVGLVNLLAPATFPEFSTFGIAMFVQWILVQVPLWIARLTFGWQMGMVDHESTAGGLRDVQFGIKHLIIWTTFVAIVLGVGKAVLQSESADSNDVIGFGLFLICNSLFAWPTVLGSLVVRWLPAIMLAAFSFVVAITFAEPFVFQAILGGKATQPNIFWWLNSIQFLWIAGSMLILRRLGFRLVRPR